MRRLIGHDIFMGLRIINATGIKDKFKNIAVDIQAGKISDVTEIGAEFLLDILAAAGDEKAEKAVFDFLAGPMEVPANDLADMDALKLFDEIKKLGEVIDQEAWASFFKQLAGVIK